MSTDTTKSERTYESAKEQWYLIAKAQDELIKAAHAFAQHPGLDEIKALKNASVKLLKLEAKPK